MKTITCIIYLCLIAAIPTAILAETTDPPPVDTGNTVLNYAQKAGRQIAGETPSPIFDEEEEEVSLDFPRNPFQQTARKRLLPGSYGRIVDGFFLRGVIETGERCMGLFEINNSDGKILRRVEQGEELRVSVSETEIVFTVKKLGDRSAVVVGENGTEYKVWL